jgi:hypothetical protein
VQLLGASCTFLGSVLDLLKIALAFCHGTKLQSR